jgi:hypothetical protein
LLSVFIGFSGRSVFRRSQIGLLDRVGLSGRPDDQQSDSGSGSSRSFQVELGFGSEKPDPIPSLVHDTAAERKRNCYVSASQMVRQIFDRKIMRAFSVVKVYES